METVTIKFDINEPTERGLIEEIFRIIHIYNATKIQYTWKGEIVDMGKGEKK